MEDLPADLKAFLQIQPFLERTDSNKIKCTLNGHEFPCNLAELQNFTSGKKYKKLCSGAEFNYSQYEPHLVPSNKEPNRLFCKLTLRHINRVPQHVLRHVTGKRYKKALAQYEECVKQGVVFVPATLKQRRRPKDDHLPSTSGEKSEPKQDSGFWAPCSSEGEDSDSGDSMSDLYPSSLFTVEKSEAAEEMEEDDFHTDEDDMEISDIGDDKQEPQKRKKVQAVGFTKKVKKNRKRKGFKPISNVKNGKK
ncbi:surfeit locus protein 2 [Brachyhypopomus gauderio]|uniref:surfeit locus protein 2 n=1 Tax=Brachyhypopomus gauderio TaxID=698409 RepID=UPI0040418ED3